MLRIKLKGEFKETTSYLNKLKAAKYADCLNKYGQLGVKALSLATPKDTGKTSESWGYTITKKNNTYTLTWTNSNIINDVCIAVILQYGHGTNNGGYVRGIDYINPALKPIFDEIADAAWKEIKAS